MHIEYQISESDYIDAMNLMRRSCKRAAIVRFYLLSALCVALAVPMAWMVAYRHGLAIEFVPAILFLLIPPLNLRMTRDKIAQRYRDNLSLHIRNYVDIDDAGCRMRDLGTDLFTPWADVSAYAESPSTFIRILDTRGQFFITPKRELTDAQVDEFRNLCRAHLPRRGPEPTRRAAKLAVAAAVIGPVVWFGAQPLLFR